MRLVVIEASTRHVQRVSLTELRDAPRALGPLTQKPSPSFLGGERARTFEGGA